MCLPLNRNGCRWAGSFWLMLFCSWSIVEPIHLAAADTTPGQVWQIGLAKAVITPPQPLWMAGYGGRTRPADGKQHDLWIRAAVLQPESGPRVAILSTDTLGMPKTIYEAVVERLHSRLGLQREHILLNATHTHCGPVLRQALPDIYPLDDKQRADVEAYSAWLTDEIVNTIEQAANAMQPATLWHGRSFATFAVNRRTNREPDVPKLRADGLLLGPVDHSVPVLVAKGAQGQLLATFFAYACHNTTLDFYQWCGDYAGFAQDELESRHPGLQAMFAMGCGADQNPLPRRTLELAKQYGRQLADAVETVLAGNDLQPVTSQVRASIELTPLKLGALPARSQLESMAAQPVNYAQRWAARMVQLLDGGEPVMAEYPYPVQAWQLGDELLWITLGGEVVVDYSLKFKGEFGYDTWVIGYANDVMAYIPSRRVLLEGGYEGQSSMMVYGMPAERWADDVEDRVTAAVQRVVQAVRSAPRP
jgi:neutral ceramidase